ncbi:MAG: ATP-binding protein, partial [Clostridia bacterium]|nr:ATP-binding protein [Clostridia bacterium]
ESVEMITNAIAEMGTHGEGFVIVDQSPSLVDIDAIKNTNTKIIMRLPEMGDCEAVGRSVSLNEQQINELSKLRTGSAVVMQNNWCDSVLTQINRYDYPYAGEIPVCESSNILNFKSAVLSELLNEYAINRTRKVTRILEVIESFDIDKYKKADAVCMVKSICGSLDKKWDSRYFGKALIQYVGADSLFRRAENNVKEIPMHGSEQKEEAKKNGADELFRLLNGEISKMFEITDQQRRTVIQYMVYAKAFDDTAVDYDWIYKFRYVR